MAKYDKKPIKPVISISRESLEHMEKEFTRLYFILFAFLVAIVLFSASTVATEFRILNPGDTAPIISFYLQLHIFILLLVSFLLGGILFSFFKKWSWAGYFLTYLYYVLSIIILAYGVWIYVVLPVLQIP